MPALPAPWASEQLKQLCRTAGPLFKEYLRLCDESGWDEIYDAGISTVRAKDVLLVIDMQNDFVECDACNTDGGRFAITEGSHVAEPIVRMMLQFSEKGGCVLASRDYHPAGHASFMPQGPFPPHCIQGSVGAAFYKPVGECLREIRSRGSVADVVFKGFNEDIDSFGACAYPDDDATWSRLSHRESAQRLYGACSLCDWTGAVAVKCSNLDNDINAPPDMLSIFDQRDMASILRKHEAKRVFVCGLALDYCVLDTCLNLRRAGFDKVYMVLDASRPSYLPNVGQYGSGFLTSPAELKAKLAARQVCLVSAAQLAPGLGVVPSRELRSALSNISPPLDDFRVRPPGFVPDSPIFCQRACVRAYGVTSPHADSPGLGQNGSGRTPPAGRTALWEKGCVKACDVASSPPGGVNGAWACDTMSTPAASAPYSDKQPSRQLKAAWESPVQTSPLHGKSLGTAQRALGDKRVRHRASSCSLM